MLVSLFLIFLGTIAFIWWLNQEGEEDKRGKKIPGPRGIPILGNVLQLTGAQHLKFSNFAHKYGDIYKLRLGSKLALVISDPKLAKEIFTNEPAFVGRQMFEGMEIYEGDKVGIAVTDGERWDTHRRFLVRNLRDFGFGKSSMEQLMMEEINETISRLSTTQKQNGCVDDIKQLFVIAVVNSLFSIVSSKKYKHDDEGLLKMMDLTEKLAKEVESRAILTLLPWTRFFVPKSKTLKAIREHHVTFYKALVDEHKTTFKKGEIRDFVDAFLNEFEGEIEEKQLHSTLFELYSAGSDTTASTLTSAVLYLSKYPETQKKLQNEIGEITADNSRPTSLSDKVNCPYTLAVIEEVSRISSVVPLGLPHSALEGREFKGYWIPKDTWLYANLYHMHHSPKIWGDPKTFRPERFLSEDGKRFKKNENVMPFQVGRRICIGKSLAEDNVFLFLTNIFQKFSIRLNPNKPEPNLEPKPSLVLCPDPYSVVLEERL